MVTSNDERVELFVLFALFALGRVKTRASSCVVDEGREGNSSGPAKVVFYRRGLDKTTVGIGEEIAKYYKLDTPLSKTVALVVKSRVCQLQSVLFRNHEFSVWRGSCYS